jgi:hypothetical protein
MPLQEREQVQGQIVDGFQDIGLSGERPISQACQLL